MIASNCSPQVYLHAISPAFSVDKTITFPVQFLLQLHNILFIAMIDIYQISLYFLLPLASTLFISKYCQAKLPLLYNNVPIVNLPLFGMFPSFLLALKYSFHDVVTDLLQVHRGTFIFKGPSFCNFEFVATSDPSNLEHILKTNFSNFCKGQSTRTVTNDFLGENYFSVDGDKWLSLRKITSVKLHLAEFNKMVMDSWVGFIQSRLLPKMDDFVKESVVFDLQDVLGTLSFDGSCVMAFGVDPGQLQEFTKAFKRAEEITALRFYFPEFLWKFMKYFNLGWEKEMKTSIIQLNDFAREVITSRKMELSKSKSKFDMLSLFIESKEVGDNQDWDKFLRDISLNVLFAGSDTISVAMSWFFWLLCKNPIAEQQIYQEVTGIVGKSDDISAMFRPEEVKKMDYLHAAIAESLRLYPPVPLNQREVNRDDELPNGVKLKKGVRVITFMYAMGRMESIWGKDCREFKPERWLRDGKFMPESPYKWPAFNAGFRNCMGKDLAYYQMKIVAASVLYHYRIHLVENHPVEPRLSTMLHMKYGLKVTLSQRNNLDC